MSRHPDVQAKISDALKLSDGRTVIGRGFFRSDPAVAALISAVEQLRLAVVELDKEGDIIDQFRQVAAGLGVEK